MLDLENIRCFLAAAKHLNFRRAAEDVALTPAAFGQRIKALEETLQCALFTRTTRSVTMTIHGHRLLPHAHELILMAQGCKEAVHSQFAPVHLSIGTRFELGLSWVAPNMVKVQEHLPHLNYDLYFGSGADILGRLEDGQLDCIITSAPVARMDWDVLFLHTETYVFVASPELLARQPFETFEDARQHVLIDINEALPLMRYFASALSKPLTFQSTQLVGTIAAARFYVLQSQGVAVLPTYLVQDDLRAGTLIPLFEEIETLKDSFRLIHQQHTVHQSTFVALAEYLRSCPLT